MKVQENYILRQIANVEDIKKKSELEKLIGTFNGYPHYIPTGAHNPTIYWQDSQTDSVDEDDEFIKERLKIERGVFREFQKIYGGEPSELFREVKQRFEKNKAITNRLLNLEVEKRKRLLPHQRFPFAEDFNGSIHKIHTKGWVDENVSLANLEFTTKLLGHGGFGGVYEAFGREGGPYAVKLFHQDTRYDPVNQRKEIRRSKEAIIDNLVENNKLFSQYPFAPLRGVVYDRDKSSVMTIMDLVEGTSLDEALYEKKEMLDNRGFVGRGLLAYATMLSIIHERGLVFMDNNPGSIIVGSEDARICDYDLVSKEGTTNKIGNDKYVSMPQVLLKEGTCLGDLESFALIVDACCNNGPLIEDSKESVSQNYKAIKERSRDYDQIRLENLPTKLREIVPHFIRYPHTSSTHSITATDFVSAIKTDYEL